MEQRKRTGVIVAAALLALPELAGPATARFVSYSGRDPIFWRSRAVVVLRVRHFTASRGHRYRIQATAVAVVATDFLVPTKLDLKAESDPRVSALRPVKTFRRGNFVIACIVRNRRFHKWWSVESDAIRFMPGTTGAVQITGLKDPLLRKIAARVYAARAAARRALPHSARQ